MQERKVSAQPVLLSREECVRFGDEQDVFDEREMVPTPGPYGLPVAMERVYVSYRCLRDCLESCMPQPGKAIFACRFSAQWQSSESSRGRGEEAAGIKRSASSLLSSLLGTTSQE